MRDNMLPNMIERLKNEELIETANEEDIDTAYDGALDQASVKKVMYLVRGLNPLQCPYN
jgi:hypothetical protein